MYGCSIINLCRSQSFRESIRSKFVWKAAAAKSYNLEYEACHLPSTSTWGLCHMGLVSHARAPLYAAGRIALECLLLLT